MELLDFPSDIAALVLDLLEIWELHRLAQTCRGFRDKVAKHGVLSACRRVRSMPKRSRQLLCNRTREILVKGLYMPTHEDPAVTEIRAQVVLCIPDAIIRLDNAKITSTSFGFEITILVSWVVQPVGFERSFTIRYFTKHDCVYTRFSLDSNAYYVFGASWLSARGFLVRLGTQGCRIVRFASELASRIRLSFAPYFPEAVRPILGSMQRYEQHMIKYKGTIFADMPPIDYGDDNMDDE